METRMLRGTVARILVVAGKITAVAVAFFIVMAASGYFTIRLVQVGRRVTVPDVTNMTLAEAQQALVPRSLMVEVAAEHYDERMEAGRIIAQEPPAGAPIKKYRKVKVITSLGPRLFKVPELRGQLLRSALIALQAEGLRPGLTAYTHTGLAEAGVVVAQDPPPEGESFG
ncbi:MAG TPA: PASTA domain-containing protein, partial [Candidatus Saccharimonadales bacterium]|nr:PASTA domain-containing protein [Candidatus Saccharimonadales bacterium]